MYKATFWKSQGAFSLLDGSPVTIANPLTGKLQPWCFSRTNGCGTAVAAEHMLTFRAGAAGLYDLQAHSGTGNFGGFRRPAFMTCKRIPAPGTSVVSGGRR